MRAHFTLLSRLYLVLAVFSALTAGASRMVLCVEPGGRVVIESGDGRCADRPDGPNGAVANHGFTVLPDGCADCVDVPLGVHQAGAARHAAPRLAAAPQAWGPSCAPFAPRSPWLGSGVREAARLWTAPGAGSPARMSILRN